MPTKTEIPVGATWLTKATSWVGTVTMRALTSASRPSLTVVAGIAR